MEGLWVYPIKDIDKLKEVIGNVLDYGLLDVEIENRASLLDDMLNRKDEKLKYAMKKLGENGIDEARLVLKEGKAILVLKIENVISIRFVLEDVQNIIKALEISGEVHEANKARSRGKNISCKL
ncbi:hypothetical protein E3E22_08695 [Thermococcus sp. MV5]|uniref:hypothetical protein n=1 Tax=Thermococcus sp. MV5 TaxID=1638272 RepID=UPI00143C61A3|nr:hypothetical protein [Thermococcus sp. MV5]NJE26691.1 hypothetical protein [Thermococcus sp. MV5]